MSTKLVSPADYFAKAMEKANLDIDINDISATTTASKKKRSSNDKRRSSKRKGGSNNKQRQRSNNNKAQYRNNSQSSTDDSPASSSTPTSSTTLRDPPPTNINDDDDGGNDQQQQDDDDDINNNTITKQQSSSKKKSSSDFVSILNKEMNKAAAKKKKSNTTTNSKKSTSRRRDNNKRRSSKSQSTDSSKKKSSTNAATDPTNNFNSSMEGDDLLLLLSSSDVKYGTADIDNGKELDKTNNSKRRSSLSKHHHKTSSSSSKSKKSDNPDNEENDDQGGGDSTNNNNTNIPAGTQSSTNNTTALPTIVEDCESQLSNSTHQLSIETPTPSITVPPHKSIHNNGGGSLSGSINSRKKKGRKLKRGNSQGSLKSLGSSVGSRNSSSKENYKSGGGSSISSSIGDNKGGNDSSLKSRGSLEDGDTYDSTYSGTIDNNNNNPATTAKQSSIAPTTNTAGEGKLNNKNVKRGSTSQQNASDFNQSDPALKFKRSLDNSEKSHPIGSTTSGGGNDDFNMSDSALFKATTSRTTNNTHNNNTNKAHKPTKSWGEILKLRQINDTKKVLSQYGTTTPYKRRGTAESRESSTHGSGSLSWNKEISKAKKNRPPSVIVCEGYSSDSSSSSTSSGSSSSNSSSSSSTSYTSRGGSDYPDTLDNSTLNSTGSLLEDKSSDRYKKDKRIPSSEGSMMSSPEVEDTVVADIVDNGDTSAAVAAAAVVVKSDGAEGIDDDRSPAAEGIRPSNTNPEAEAEFIPTRIIPKRRLTKESTSSSKSIKDTKPKGNPIPTPRNSLTRATSTKSLKDSLIKDLSEKEKSDIRNSMSCLGFDNSDLSSSVDGSGLLKDSLTSIRSRSSGGGGQSSVEEEDIPSSSEEARAAIIRRLTKESSTKSLKDIKPEGAPIRRRLTKENSTTSLKNSLKQTLSEKERNDIRNSKSCLRFDRRDSLQSLESSTGNSGASLKDLELSSSFKSSTEGGNNSSSGRRMTVSGGEALKHSLVQELSEKERNDIRNSKSCLGFGMSSPLEDTPPFVISPNDENDTSPKDEEDKVGGEEEDVAFRNSTGGRIESRPPPGGAVNLQDYEILDISNKSSNAAGSIGSVSLEEMCDSIITGDDDNDNGASIGSSNSNSDDDDDSETSAQRHFRESQLMRQSQLMPFGVDKLHLDGEDKHEIDRRSSSIALTNDEPPPLPDIEEGDSDDDSFFNEEEMPMNGETDEQRLLRQSQLMPFPMEYRKSMAKTSDTEESPKASFTRLSSDLGGMPSDGILQPLNEDGEDDGDDDDASSVDSAANNPLDFDTRSGSSGFDTRSGASSVVSSSSSFSDMSNMTEMSNVTDVVLDDNSIVSGGGGTNFDEDGEWQPDKLDMSNRSGRRTSDNMNENSLLSEANTESLMTAEYSSNTNSILTHEGSSLLTMHTSDRSSLLTMHASEQGSSILTADRSNAGSLLTMESSVRTIEPNEESMLTIGNYENDNTQPLSTIIDVSIRSGLDASALDASGRSPVSIESKESISDEAALLAKSTMSGESIAKSITSEEKKLSKEDLINAKADRIARSMKEQLDASLKSIRSGVDSRRDALSRTSSTRLSIKDLSEARSIKSDKSGDRLESLSRASSGRFSVKDMSDRSNRSGGDDLAIDDDDVSTLLPEEDSDSDASSDVDSVDSMDESSTSSKSATSLDDKSSVASSDSSQSSDSESSSSTDDGKSDSDSQSDSSDKKSSRAPNRRRSDVSVKSSRSHRSHKSYKSSRSHISSRRRSDVSMKSSRSHKSHKSHKSSRSHISSHTRGSSRKPNHSTSTRRPSDASNRSHKSHKSSRSVATRDSRRTSDTPSRRSSQESSVMRSSTTSQFSRLSKNSRQSDRTFIRRNTIDMEANAAPNISRYPNHSESDESSSSSSESEESYHSSDSSKFSSSSESMRSSDMSSDVDSIMSRSSRSSSRSRSTRSSRRRSSYSPDSRSTSSNEKYPEDSRSRGSGHKKKRNNSLDSISIGLDDQDVSDLEKQLSPSLIKFVGDKAAAEGEARKLVTTPSPIELTPTRRPSVDILTVNDAPPVAEEGNADDAVALARLTRFMERTLPTDEEDVVEDKMDTEVAAANDQVDDKKEDDQKVEEEEPKIVKKVSFSLLRRQSSRKLSIDSTDEGKTKEAKPPALRRRKWIPKRSSSRKLASEGDESLTEESTVSSYSYNPKKIQKRAKRGSSPKPKSSTTEDAKPKNDEGGDEDELFQDPTRDHMVSFSDLSVPDTTPSYRSAHSQRLSSSERGGRRLSISERNEQNHRNARMARASSDVTQNRKASTSRQEESFSKSDNYLVASAYYPGQDDHATSTADRDAKEEALMADAIAQSLPEAVPVVNDTGYAEEEKCDEDGIAVDQSQTRVVSRRKSNRLLKSSGSRVKKFGFSFLDMTGKSKKKGPIDVDTCEPASAEVMNASVVESSRSLMATSDGFDSRGTQRAFLGDSIDEHYDRRRQFAASHSPPQQEQSSRPSPHHHDSYGSYRSNRSSSNSSQQNNHRRGSHRNSGGGSISSRQWDEYSRRRDGYDDYRGGSSSRRRYDDDRRRRHHDDHYDRGRGYDGRGDNSVVSEIYVDQYASSGYRDHRQQQRRGYQLSDAGSVTSSSMYSSYGGGGGYRSHYHDPRGHSYNPHYHRGAYDPYYRGSGGGGSSEVSWDDLGDPIQAALESSIRDLSSQVVGNQLVAKKRVLKPEEPVLSDVDIGPWQCRNCGFANANGRHLQCAVCSTNR